MRKKLKGFTLIELMIVIAIIGILAAVALPNFKKAREQAVMTACYKQLKEVDKFLIQYSLENSNFPDTLATLFSYYNQSQKPDHCPKSKSLYVEGGSITPVQYAACPQHYLFGVWYLKNPLKDFAATYTTTAPSGGPYD